MEKISMLLDLIDPMFIMPEVRKLLNYTPREVIHRDRCTACGRNLVNIYKYGEEWLCMRCIDIANKLPPKE